MHNQFAEMTIDERRIAEKNLFNELKQKKDRSGNMNEGQVAAVYAINSVWIEKWKNFLRYRNQPLPGEINNQNMKSFILQKRKENPDSSNDDFIELKHGEDYYEFSYQTWRFFIETYGGGPTIIVKYFRKDRVNVNNFVVPHQYSESRSLCITDSSQLKSQVSIDEYFSCKRGKYFNSFQEKMNPNTLILQMPPSLRRKKEDEAFKNIHTSYSNSEQSNAIYIIDVAWFKQWLNYQEKHTEPPQKINNKQLEYKLVVEDNSDKLQRDRDYYIIPKQAWEFLFNIYGGGPTIIKNDDEYNSRRHSRANSDREETKQNNYNNNESQGSFEPPQN